MRTAALLLAVSCAIAPGAASAQGRPDFSGTWRLPPDAPLTPNRQPAAAPGFGPAITIIQDGQTITISRMIGGQIGYVTHPLDGRETRSRTPGRLCEGDSHAIWTAEWQGDSIRLTLVGSRPPGGSAATEMNVQTALTMTTPDTMRVDVTVRNRGESGPRVTTTTYRRTGPAEAAPPPSPAPLAANIGQLAWLGGTWIGTTDSSTFEERWAPPAGGSMLAVARTLRNGVMNGFEFLCISERNGGLVYQAMPNGRQPATDFTLTRIEPNSVTFENPAHDFPKRIRYTLGADGTLEAVISGTDERSSQTFRFKKQ